MKNFNFRFSVLFAGLLLSVTFSQLGHSDEPPNVLLILADDMGYGDLGCYGSTQIETPNLDSLANGGVRFTDAYVAASVCAPSRAGLLTGRYPQRFGFEHNLERPSWVKPERVGIPLDEILVSQRMKDLGYRTGIVGKWHVGEHSKEQHPSARGFDFFFGMLGGGHHYWPTLENNRLLRNGEPIQEIREAYLTDWFSLEAMDFIDRNQKQPWFLFLSYNTPHTPMQARQDDLEACAHIEPAKRRKYCAMQRCMDRNIGKIIDKLRETGQLENTLIVFASDNGGSVGASAAINAPLNGQKGCFLEGGIRVPMIMHWPAKLKAGQIYSQPVISLDWTPTFVEAAGGTVAEELIGEGKRAFHRKRDGVNLLPFLQTTDSERPANMGLPHQTLYWRMALRGQAIRKGDWKLIQTPYFSPMLFNLATDVSEQNNLATQHPEKVDELLSDLADWTASFRSNPMWISDNFWSRYNRRLYQQEYATEQPSGNDTRH